MPEDKKNPHVLKQPNTSGPQQEVTPEGAYLAAITSLPRILSDLGKVLTSILDEMNGVHDKLDVIALYHERKGIDEHLFGPEDLQGEGDEQEPEC